MSKEIKPKFKIGDIVDYIVVSELDIDTLTNTVKENLKLGYQPIGGAFATSVESSFGTNKVWHQTMILEKNWFRKIFKI